MAKRTFSTLFIAILAMPLHAELITPQLNSPQIQNLAAHALKSSDKKFNDSLPASINVIEKLNAVSAMTVKKFSQTGTASWYGRQFHGRKTATGEKFNMNALTAAHPTLPLNCSVRVTNQSNGKSVIVKINDRGPFNSNRVLDLSYGAAKALDIADQGLAKVKIERIDY